MSTVFNKIIDITQENSQDSTQNTTRNYIQDTLDDYIITTRSKSRKRTFSSIDDSDKSENNDTRRNPVRFLRGKRTGTLKTDIINNNTGYKVNKNCLLKSQQNLRFANHVLKLPYTHIDVVVLDYKYLNTTKTLIDCFNDSSRNLTIRVVDINDQVLINAKKLKCPDNVIVKVYHQNIKEFLEKHKKPIHAFAGDFWGTIFNTGDEIRSFLNNIKSHNTPSAVFWATNAIRGGASKTAPASEITNMLKTIIISMGVDIETFEPTCDGGSSTANTLYTHSLKAGCGCQTKSQTMHAAIMNLSYCAEPQKKRAKMCNLV